MIKYIIIDNLFPIIFQGKFSHSNFKHFGNITSAGFISENFENCYGYSQSLNLNSKPDDIYVIKIFLGNNEK